MEVALTFITLAREQASNKNYVTAFNTYIRALDLHPTIREEIKKEFRTVFLHLHQVLAAQHNKMKIFNNFERVLKIYPDNVDLLNDIGTYLYQYSYIYEALYHFEKALTIDSNHIKIEKNLNNVKSCLIPRTIFNKLNDKMRNQAYRAAITSTINSGTDSVINIDAGIGLLTLYASECNPLAVTACEPSDTSVQLAECVMQDNKASQVVIINQPSVILNQTDIYGLKSILITDMIDAGLFGNNILQSLNHAFEQLLHSESKVIPGRAEFFVAGVNCVELNSKYKLCQHTKNILNIPHKHVHATDCFRDSDSYYSEDVRAYNNLQYICEPHSLFTIDFNSRDQVLKMLDRQRPYNALFKPTVDDEMNSVIGWFNLHLTDDIMLTSDPRSENSTKSFQQAVFFYIVPRKVRQNENFTIPFVPYGGRLTALNEPGQVVSRVSHETIIFLNDTEYVNMIKQSVAMVCLHLGQTMSIEDVDIVDLCPFPLFGILMMKRGAKSLICKANSRWDISFLNSVLEQNEISSSKINILQSRHCSLRAFHNKKFHVVISNIFDFSGEIDVRQKKIIHHLQKSHLASNGIVLPESVSVMGQLVYSEELEMSNRVVDDNVECRMAKHVSRYQASQLSYLDITQLNFDPLSEPFEISPCSSYAMRSTLVRVPIQNDGECNAILCWYKVQLVDGWNCTYTNRRGSFISSSAYITNPHRKLLKDDEQNVLFCADLDGTFKIKLDV